MKLLRLAAGLLICALPAPSSAETLRGVVVGVSDGDTITLLTPDKRPVRIRLAEIDAPELHGQPFGRAAKTALSSLVYRRQVTAEVVTVDRYGRAVALVDVAGVDVNAAMVRAGMAWAYVRYQTDPRFSSLEATAKSQRRGLWRDPLPIPPWRYRRSADDERDRSNKTRPFSRTGRAVDLPRSPNWLVFVPICKPHHRHAGVAPSGHEECSTTTAHAFAAPVPVDQAETAAAHGAKQIEIDD